MKRTNNGAQPDGQPLVEFVEKRPSAKGNPEQTTVTGTQRPEAVSSELDTFCPRFGVTVPALMYNSRSLQG